MATFRAVVPAMPTVLVDDTRTRVTRWDFEPGAETGFHRHGMDYVVVPMTDLDLLITDSAGERRVSVAAGAAYTRQAGVEHNVANAGSAPASFIEIEIKSLT
jgi:quercetin dioxygenase-like cupin family protein